MESLPSWQSVHRTCHIAKANCERSSIVLKSPGEPKKIKTVLAVMMAMTGKSAKPDQDLMGYAVIR